MRIVWYFVDDDAPHYEGEHCWEPVEYLEDRFNVEDYVGELPYVPTTYHDGANPGVDVTGEPCGTAADFLGQGTPPLDPATGRVDFSRMPDCPWGPTIGLGCRHRLWERFNAMLELEAAADDWFVTHQQGAAELVLEADADEAFTHGDLGEAELELEAGDGEETPEVGEAQLELEAEEDESGGTGDVGSAQLELQADADD